MSARYRFYFEDPETAGDPKSVASLYKGLTYQNAFFMFRETEIAHGEYVPFPPPPALSFSFLPSVPWRVQVFAVWETRVWGVCRRLGRVVCVCARVCTYVCTCVNMCVRACVVSLRYDVPQCAAGTPPAQCVHTVEGNFQLQDAMHECKGRSDVWCSPVNIPNASYPQSQHVALVHVAPHCHGPACISMEMINQVCMPPPLARMMPLVLQTDMQGVSSGCEA